MHDKEYESYIDSVLAGIKEDTDDWIEACAFLGL